MLSIYVIQIKFLNFEDLFAAMKTTSKLLILTLMKLILIVYFLSTKITLNNLMNFCKMIFQFVFLHKKLIANHARYFFLLMNSFYVSVKVLLSLEELLACWTLMLSFSMSFFNVSIQLFSFSKTTQAFFTYKVLIKNSFH